MNKVLFIEPNNPGDILMATVAVRTYKKKNPQSEIHFLVDQECAPLLENNPHIDHCHVFKRSRLKSLFYDGRSGWKNAEEDLDYFIKKLCLEKFNRIINFFQNPIGPLFTKLITAAEITGATINPYGDMVVRDKWSRYLYAIPYARQYTALHVSDIFCRIAGVTSENEGPVLILKRDEEKFAEDFFARRGLKNNTVAFQAGSAYSSKRWLVEYYMSLASLLRDNGYEILFLGAPQEADFINNICVGITPKPVIAAGKTTIRESAALIKKCAVLITGDTAAMHMAAAFGKRAVCIFGPTSPRETGPYCQGFHILGGQCECFGNYTSSCPDQKCMRAVTPEMVLACAMGKEYKFGPEIRHAVSSWDGENSRMVYPGWESEEVEQTSLSLLRAFDGENQRISASYERENLKTLLSFAEKADEIIASIGSKIDDRSVFDELKSKYNGIELEMDRLPGCAQFLVADYRIKNNSLNAFDPLLLCSCMSENLKQMKDLLNRLIGSE
ncbi:MAG: glycosyltransferase family 9 protein [Elusimicrobiota bacterium]